MKLRLEDCDSNPTSSAGEEDDDNVSTISTNRRTIVSKNLETVENIEIVGTANNVTSDGVICKVGFCLARRKL